MKKMRQAIAALAVAATLSATASPLTPAEALARLGNDGADRAPARVRVAPRLVSTVNTSAGVPAVYVFDAASGPGYMVLSADDCVAPLLGYSDEGSLSGDALPPALEWWLGEYSRQIEWMAARGLSAASRSRADRAPIAPMLTTEWDQGAPYNSQCPRYGTQRTYTGCVATSMAQVMNYWKYPAKGRGSITYQSETLQKRLSLDFSLRKFDWDNMLPVYIDDSWNQTQADAVGYLMKAAGYAVHMDYGVDSSGALAMNITEALTRYFDYDPNITYALRACYSLSQWEEMIYNNLRDCGPILYGGGSYIGGGHSFVCDGYDGEGYFHFNWGWTGMSNGYFSLDVLDPYSLGAGGGFGGGYNFTQDAVLGIRPPTGKPAEERPVTLVQQGSLIGAVEGNTLTISLNGQADPMWVNYNPATLHIEFGAQVTGSDVSAPVSKVLAVTDKVFTLKSGDGTGPSLFTMSADLASAGLPDGSYKVSVVIRSTDAEDAAWVPVIPAWGYAGEFVLTKAGTAYTVDNTPYDQLAVISSKVIGGLTYGLANRFEITVANLSDVELSRGFAPCVIYDGKAVMLGESVLLTVPAGGQVTREWTTPLYLLDNQFDCDRNILVTLMYMDETTYGMYGTGSSLPVVLKPNPGVPQLITAAPKVLNATVTVADIDGEQHDLYVCDDRRDIQVSAAVTLVQGTFAYPMYACVASPSQENPSQIALDTYAGHTVFFDKAGETIDFTTSVVFPQAIPGQIYRILMGYSYGSNLIQIGPEIAYFRIGSTGVEDVAADSPVLGLCGRTVSASDPDALVEVYSVAGLRVAAGTGAADVSSLIPGVYIARCNESVFKFHLY